jgi:hypothetical protein
MRLQLVSPAFLIQVGRRVRQLVERTIRPIRFQARRHVADCQPLLVRREFFPGFTRFLLAVGARIDAPEGVERSPLRFVLSGLF